MSRSDQSSLPNQSPALDQSSFSAPSSLSDPLLCIKQIRKRFGATQALGEVSLSAHAGRVLALIGENGAGKSTLMKILSGVYQPDAGTMQLAGRSYAPRGPLQARQAGVAMIYQELSLAPDLSIEDNLCLGSEQSTFGWLRRDQQRPRVQAVLDRLGHGDLDPRQPVRELSVATQQVVEIARALLQEARLIVFDEPTSSLTRADTLKLFEVIRKLTADGRAVIYISHFLEEVQSIGDDYAVLRDGFSVGSGVLDGVTDDQLVALMVGRTVGELFPHVPHTPGGDCLAIDGLSGQRAPRDVSLTLRTGEIFGLAGLVGAGRTEFVRCLLGLDPHTAKRLEFRQRPLRGGPRARLQAGLGLVSEDRKGEGLAQSRSLAENLTLSHLQPYSNGGWLSQRRLRAAARDWLARLQVKYHSLDQPMHQLSGGNQQKIALARVLHEGATVLLLDEPTRGIDVGTKSEIYRLMGELAAQGKTVVFVSSYLTELLAVCDRIGVMCRGRLQAVRPTSEWTEAAIMSVATGGG